MEILALAGQNGIPHRPVQQTRAERGVKASNGIGTPGGLIDTAQSRRLYPGEERQKFAEHEIILGTFGGPEDIGNAVTPLVLPRARSITDIVLTVADGMPRDSFSGPDAAGA